jgi:hypothetical protein
MQQCDRIGYELIRSVIHHYSRIQVGFCERPHKHVRIAAHIGLSRTQLPTQGQWSLTVGHGPIVQPSHEKE